MDYSIVIPVFNKAGFTQRCLRSLAPTLREGGTGEVLVVDNASTDSTAQVLAEFEWVRVIANDRNLGFAAANNQGARAARGRYLVLLNNDTEVRPGWLRALLGAAGPGVGIVGARLLFPDETIQHAGVAFMPFRLGWAAFGAFHDLQRARKDTPGALQPAQPQAVTAACMLTPRELYLALGGLDENYRNGCEDVDYCLRVRERGLRVVYEPRSVVVHYESKSGPQRWRRANANLARLAERWNGRVVYDHVSRAIERGEIRREVRSARGGHTFVEMPIPKTTVLVHGACEPARRRELERAVRDARAPICEIRWAEAGEAAYAALEEALEVRGDRYLALVDARTQPHPGWLDELVRQVEFGHNVAAATYAPEVECSEHAAVLAADARCTLLSLRYFPQHLRVRRCETLGASVADLLLRGRELHLSVRAAAFAIASVPALEPDARFAQLHGMQPADVLSGETLLLEERLRAVPKRERGLVSIVTLSWNAPEFTKLALESIREHTSAPYEVIVVDNGSGPQTTQWLATLEDVRVIYNAENRGFAGGNNQGIAAARGDFIVLLNNDVIVTDGWLDGLLDPFDRIPGLGVTAPRSNRIAGDQITIDSEYRDVPAMHEYAAQRRARLRRQGYLTDRAIGLCLCVDRRVIDEIGGIDERYAVGNFEDDDFCIRVRAAGYKIYVCDDVFIHHFGSQSFAANKVDYASTMHANWQTFAAKWGYPPAYPQNGYDPRIAIARGFDRAKHYVALPKAAPQSGEAAAYRAIFAAVVRDERDWNEVSAFLRRYVKAFRPDDRTLLSIAALGEGAPDAATLGRRAERAIAKAGLQAQAVADVEIADEEDVQEWIGRLPAPAYRLGSRGIGAYDALTPVSEPNPSALRRLLEVRA